MRRGLLVSLLVLTLAGCDGGEKPSGPESRTPPPTPTVQQTTSLRVYFLRDGKVQPVRREVPRTPAVAGASLLELLRGPDARERDALAVTSGIPDGTKWNALSIVDGVARVRLDHELARAARAQLVYTLTQFPTVRAVELEGRRYTRADFEALTPAILVESPLPFERVASPLRARGTANTFEANFEYELRAPGGGTIAGDFVTATSGTGTRGMFDFSAPFARGRHGVGALVVLERSAADGSRINVVEIPIHM